MDNFWGVLKQTAFFVVAARIMQHFLPGKKYDSYGRVLVALIVLSQLAVPILSFGKKELAESFLQKAEQLEAENEMFSRQLDDTWEGAEELVEDGLMLSVEERVAGAAAQAGMDVEAVRVEGSAVIIEVSPQGQHNQVQIDPVTIEPVMPAQESREEEPAASVRAGAVKGRYREELSRSFADALGLQDGEVEVIETE